MLDGFVPALRHQDAFRQEALLALTYALMQTLSTALDARRQQRLVLATPRALFYEPLLRLLDAISKVEAAEQRFAKA